MGFVEKSKRYGHHDLNNGNGNFAIFAILLLPTIKTVADPSLTQV